MFQKEFGGNGYSVSRVAIFPAIGPPITAIIAPNMTPLISGLATIPTILVAFVTMVPAIMARADHDDSVGRRAGWTDNHDATSWRAIGAGNDHRLAVTRWSFVVPAIAVGVFGDRGEQQTGGDADGGTFGSVMIIVLSNDRAGDAPDHGIAGCIVPGIESGGDCCEQAGRAGKREKKAVFHTPTETFGCGRGFGVMRRIFCVGKGTFRDLSVRRQFGIG